ncbi:MAG: segregation and condensation protein A, partial [Gammaproteobacteria bacterium]
PLSAATVQGIRECLALISAREQELAREHGRSTSARPRFIDEPDPEVVVPLDVSAMKRNLKKSDD